MFGMQLDGIVSFPLSMVLDSSPSNSFALFWEAENGVYFQFFRKEYLFSWKTFAGHLDFNKRSIISLEQACRNFNRHEIWGEISGQVLNVKFAPRCSDIHNPTLQLMHKLLAITLLPRDDV